MPAKHCATTRSRFVGLERPSHGVPAPTWTHHVLTESAQGAIELVLGETRQDDVPLATFVAAARIDEDGRIDRYVVGRSTSVLFGLD